MADKDNCCSRRIMRAAYLRNERGENARRTFRNNINRVQGVCYFFITSP